MNRSFHLLSVLTTLSLPAVVSGQQLATYPSASATVPGSSYEGSFPFGNGISRVQAVYDNWDLTIPNGATITAVGFRQELGIASPARAVQLEVYMGAAAHTSANISYQLANNYAGGVAPTKVFGPAIFNLPALSASATTPQNVMVTLATPHTYDASQPLLVEFRILANNNGNLSFTYYVDRSTYYSTTSQFGQGCLASSQLVPSLAFQPAYIGGNLGASLTNAPASSFIYLNLNTVQSTPVLGGPFGAPGCTLYVPPVLVETQQAGSGSGSAYFNIPIPNTTSFYNFDVYGQCLIADLFANSLGFVSSNAAKVTIGAYATMATCTGYNSATAANGSPYPSHGVVTLFQY